MMPGVLLVLAVWVAAGLALGAAYFALLWWGVQGLADGRRSVLAMLVWAGRFVLLAGVLLLAGRQGALPLLAAAAGVLGGRALVLRRLRREIG